MISDLTAGAKVKRQKVRQEIARQLTFRYHLAPESMTTDFPIGVNGDRKSVDIAIFEPGDLHDATNLRRAVICRPFPKRGKKAFVDDRDFAQALKAWMNLRLL